MGWPTKPPFHFLQKWINEGASPKAANGRMTGLEPAIKESQSNALTTWPHPPLKQIV